MIKQKAIGSFCITGLAGIACFTGVTYANETVILDETLLVTGGSINGSLIPFLETPQTEHCDQEELINIADPAEQAAESFECGDELFGFEFNALDGGGAHVGDGQRYTRVPRADKAGPGEWLNHIPARATGPNSESCGHCHLEPATGSGFSGLNAVRDPVRGGQVGQFINRNTPHLMGSGAVQLVAESMTSRMEERVAQGQIEACNANEAVTVELDVFGTDFGSVDVECDGSLNTAALEGVDDDLIVRAFGWKGRDLNIRQFTRNASHNEIGMQAIELIGEGVDGDGDGVANELSVGDISAMTIYVAGQVRPITKLELDFYGLMGLLEEDPLSFSEIEQIEEGQIAFREIGCDSCHDRQKRTSETVFTEPSQVADFRDAVFPAGQDPVAMGVTPEQPLSFDLTRDIPDNVFEVKGREVRLGNFQTDDRDRMIVNLFSDLKRHDMGPELAESIDEVGTGNSTWMTTRLWGVGSTAPYLHDGRASTLTEAILFHGGEGADSRERFLQAETSDQESLLAFLNNLVLIREE